MVTIRPIEQTEADYEKLATVWNAAQPERQLTAEWYRLKEENRNPDKVLGTFLAEADGEPVAQGVYGQFSPSGKPYRIYLVVTVHPDWRRRGIGTAMYEALVEQVMPFDPIMLGASVLEDATAGLAMLAKHGYKQVQRQALSELDVTSFDPAPFQSAVEKTQRAGIEIVTLAELLEQGEGVWHDVYDLHTKLSRDVPMPIVFVPDPAEVWIERMKNRPNLIRDGFFIGMKDGRMVGLAYLYWAPADKTKMNQGLTGVVREWRRHGLATTLKLHTIACAQQKGATVIRTDNEENNPMYDINVKLGFRPKPGMLLFAKSLRTDE